MTDNVAGFVLVILTRKELGMATQVKPSVAVPSGIDVIAGIWLLVSPYVLALSTVAVAATMSNVICGAVVAILAAVSTSGAYERDWPSWLSGFLGLWVVASPWIFGFSTMATATWSNVVTGIIIAVFGFWSGSIIASKQSFRDMPS